MNGEGVEKDVRKEIKHAETAAIGGHPGARMLLSKLEMNNGNINKAVKHLLMAAKQGFKDAIDFLKWLYVNESGVVSKEVLDEALRGYQKALDMMKSPQRDAAEKLKKSD